MISNISDETRKELVIDLQKNVKDAIDIKNEIESKLNLITLKINDYYELMNLLGVSVDDIYFKNEHITSNDNKIESPLSSGKITWAQKILEVLDKPSKYGFKLFRGIDNIFTAIAVEYNQQTDWENRVRIKRILSPTVSRLIKERAIIKIKKKGTVDEHYQISANWLAEGSKKPLPEYEEILRDYEIVE